MIYRHLTDELCKNKLQRATVDQWNVMSSGLHCGSQMASLLQPVLKKKASVIGMICDEECQRRLKKVAKAYPEAMITR